MFECRVSSDASGWVKDTLIASFKLQSDAEAFVLERHEASGMKWLYIKESREEPEERFIEVLRRIIIRGRMVMDNAKAQPKISYSLALQEVEAMAKEIVGSGVWSDAIDQARVDLKTAGGDSNG